MKKLLFTALLFIGIIGMSSCEIDDSNDIDFITPNDTTQTGAVELNEGSLRK